MRSLYKEQSNAKEENVVQNVQPCDSTDRLVGLKDGSEEHIQGGSSLWQQRSGKVIGKAVVLIVRIEEDTKYSKYPQPLGSAP